MTLDYNDFTIEEQQLINYTVEEFKNKDKQGDLKLWTKFLRKGFNSVCKTIAKKKF